MITAIPTTATATAAAKEVTVFDRLRRHARERPYASAFTITDARGVTHLGWADLLVRVRAFAHGLEAAGVARGEPVAVALTTSAELVALVLATQSLGALPMVVNPSLPPSAIARRAALVEARLLIDAAQAPAFASPASGEPRAWATPADPHELAYLQLTSGTTGEPRAAAVTHAALAENIIGTEYALLHETERVYVNWVPLHHDLGLVRFLMTPVYWGSHVHHLPPTLTSLRLWLKTLSAARATVTGAPDFAWRIAARSISPEGIDLRHLRLATNGGEPVRASTIALFEERFGCRGAIQPGYGLAEATLRVSGKLWGEPLVVDARGHVGCGRAMPGLELRITRGEDIAPAGTSGDIEIRGPSLFSGYYDPRAADRLDRSAFARDGWLATGDTGYLDAGGNVFVLGRTRAMIKQAGALIAPREVEEIVDGVPGVRLSAAIGLPNAWDDAEELAVVAEARPEIDDVGRAALRDAIQRAVRAHVGVAPGRIVIAPPRTIPLTANGKIRHAALREQVLTDRPQQGNAR